MKSARFGSFGFVVLAALAACGGSNRSTTTDGGAGRDGSTTASGGRVGSGGSTGSGGAVSGGTSGGNTGGAPASGGTSGVDAGSSSGGATVATGGTSGAAGSFTVGTAQCSDGSDNDADGKIDSADPDCVSPLDNDESSLSTGIAGDNMDACKQDCFFDGNSGMGDDGCDWNLKCDAANTNPGQCMYDSNFKNCSTMQSQRCVNSCRKLTPNGCDCFGCCTVPGVNYPVRLTATCNSANFGDPTKCPACTQSPSCNNDCGRCELCLGKTSIPADCGAGGAGGSGAGGAGGSTVDGGTPPPPTPDCGDYQPCGPSGTDPSACGGGEICITGCCIPT